MEVTALCVTLLLKVLLLLAAHVQNSYPQNGYAAFLHVVPSRLQFFEYESISLTCEEFDSSTKWTGVRNADDFVPDCSRNTATSTVTCTIYNTFETDSGEYWCEAGLGERSNSVNITITSDVILESPVLPVIEGDAVTLRCSNRTTSFNHRADFYKDGLRVSTGYYGKMTISSVSKSDEGLYKCTIPRIGESPESRLTVINTGFMEGAGSVVLESPVLPVMEGDAVILRCRNKTKSTSLPAVFYKDGLFIGRSSTGTVSIRHVEKSHEGLYRCNIFGVGESPGRWLAVRGEALHGETCVCSDHSVFTLLLLRTVFTVVMVALLLLLVGLLHFGKLQSYTKITLGPRKIKTPE